eukprot:COSAG01_NODE_10678_length_2106_cov_24.723966_2_plen_50_part_00
MQGNPCTAVNMTGVVLVICGAGLYNIVKTPAGSQPAAAAAARVQKRKKA